MLIKKKLIRLETHSRDNWKTLEYALEERKKSRKEKMKGRMDGKRYKFSFRKVYTRTLKYEPIYGRFHDRIIRRIVILFHKVVFYAVL